MSAQGIEYLLWALLWMKREDGNFVGAVFISCLLLSLFNPCTCQKRQLALVKTCLPLPLYKLTTFLHIDQAATSGAEKWSLIAPVFI